MALASLTVSDSDGARGATRAGRLLASDVGRDGAFAAAGTVSDRGSIRWPVIA